MSLEGVIVGSCDHNPKLNSIDYHVKFSDSQVKENTCNMIAESMLTIVDSEGFSLTLMDSIEDWKKYDNTTELVDKHVITSNS